MKLNCQNPLLLSEIKILILHIATLYFPLQKRRKKMHFSLLQDYVIKKKPSDVETSQGQIKIAT